MNAKTVIAVCAAVLTAAAATLVYLAYSNSDYTVYSRAFRKTFNTDSIELDTGVRVAAGALSASSSGRLRMKDMNATTRFVNEMSVNGQAVTQFGDGEYIYTDDGVEKRRVSAEEIPRATVGDSGGAFSFDAYINSFAAMLDIGKIRELRALEPIEEKYVESITVLRNGEKRSFEFILIPEAVELIIAAFLNENADDPALAPDVSIVSFSYTVVVEDGYAAEVAYRLRTEVTPPFETASTAVSIDFTLKTVNPGTPVEFSLPPTDGYR
jgi:hypothetical protein